MATQTRNQLSNATAFHIAQWHPLTVPPFSLSYMLYTQSFIHIVLMVNLILKTWWNSLIETDEAAKESL